MSTGLAMDLLWQAAEGGGLGAFGLFYVGFLVVGATLLVGLGLKKKPEDDGNDTDSSGDSTTAS